MRTFRHPFVPAASSAPAAHAALPHQVVRRSTDRGGKMPGMVICMVIGHQVAWGPCPRCDRRASG
jgi:hypothetical protein